MALEGVFKSGFVLTRTLTALSLFEANLSRKHLKTRQSTLGKRHICTRILIYNVYLHIYIYILYIYNVYLHIYIYTYLTSVCLLFSRPVLFRCPERHSIPQIAS